MPSPERRSPFLSTLLLSGILIGLPWTAGGRSPVGQVGLVLVLVLAGVMTTLGHSPTALAKPSPLLLAGGVLVAGSALHTIYPDRTIQTLLLLLAYLLAGTLAADAARESPQLERILLTVILVSGTLTTVVGMLRVVQYGDEGMYAGLLTGPFGYPNAMAGFLLLTAGAALALVSGLRHLALRAGTIAAFALALVGLLLTRSRGAWLAAVTGLAVWIVVQWWEGWPRRGLWVWLVGCSFLTLVAFISWKLGGSVVNSRWLAERQEVSSLIWRWQILQWTWAMARDHPWWGVGPGAFPVALTHYQRIPYVSSENPHNLFLELSAEYGLPAAILALCVLVVFLGRVGRLIRRTPDSDSARGRQAALLATLIAFGLHSLVDLDWSFPAIAATAAAMIGLTSAQLQKGIQREVHGRPLWRGAFVVILLVAAFMSITRYYASTLVSWARLAVASREAVVAQHELTWALHLNPLSFPAHQSMAWTRLLSGDPSGAAEVAEQAIRIAPSDPNSHYLAGEIAAASGRWNVAEDRFRDSADLAPSAQLRFHGSLVESAVNSGHMQEAQFEYDRASSIFTEERVLNTEARCLMPGDRYLLARMTRIAARAFGHAGASFRQDELLERAKLLAQPDPRGICVTRGRAGQTSPEAAMDSFWHALADGGWAKAEKFLSPPLRVSQPKGYLGPWLGENRPRRAYLAWIATLSGGEHEANLRFDVEFEVASDSRINRCGQAELRLIGESWFVDRLPVLDPIPCQP